MIVWQRKKHKISKISTKKCLVFTADQMPLQSAESTHSGACTHWGVHMLESLHTGESTLGCLQSEFLTERLRHMMVRSDSKPQSLNFRAQCRTGCWTMQNFVWKFIRLFGQNKPEAASMQFENLSFKKVGRRLPLVTRPDRLQSTNSVYSINFIATFKELSNRTFK